MYQTYSAVKAVEQYRYGRERNDSRRKRARPRGRPYDRQHRRRPRPVIRVASSAGRS